MSRPATRVPGSVWPSSAASWKNTADASSSAMPPIRSPASAAHGCDCALLRKPRARARPIPRLNLRPLNLQPTLKPWLMTSLSSTTKRISGNWFPASCRTKALSRAPRATATTRWPASSSRRPNLVYLDIWLQGSRLDGLQLLDAMKAQHPELPIVMISGHGNIETAVAAIKQGAYDVIEKPFKADRLVLVAQRASESSRFKREVKALK